MRKSKDYLRKLRAFQESMLCNEEETSYGVFEEDNENIFYQYENEYSKRKKKERKRKSDEEYDMLEKIEEDKKIKMEKEDEERRQKKEDEEYDSYM